ncbi:MAG: polysaccharide deacetylase family protein [Patescibacteria group bacterium]|nr:polysaccharide deacetylase family protein [Patescibacteria group bacterium]
MKSVESRGEIGITRRAFLAGTAAGAVSVFLNPVDALARTFTTNSSTESLISADKLAGTGRIIGRGDITKPYIFFTIDDCYGIKAVYESLDIGDRQEVKFTYFVIGKLLRIPVYRKMVREIVKRGHRVENHTVDHAMLGPRHTSELPKVRFEIGGFLDLMKEYVDPDYQDHFVRPPGGVGIDGKTFEPLIDTAKTDHLDIAGWSISTNGTSREATPATSYNNVKDRLKNGRIVLLHANGINPDIAVFEKLIITAKDQGINPIDMLTGLEKGLFVHYISHNSALK